MLRNAAEKKCSVQEIWDCEQRKKIAEIGDTKAFPESAQMVLPLHRAKPCGNEADPENRAGPGAQPDRLRPRGIDQGRIVVGRCKVLSKQRAKKKEKHRINPILVADHLSEMNEKDCSHSKITLGLCKRTLISDQDVEGGTVQIFPSETRTIWEGATGISEGCMLTSRWRSRWTFSSHRLTR